MSFRSRHVYRAAWIAIFAILLNTLAPAITSVKAAMHGRSSAMLQIGHHAMRATDAAPPCGSAARDEHDIEPMPHHDTNRAADPDCAQEAAPQADECPFCHVHAGSFGLPAMPPQDALITRFADDHPYLFYQAPRHFFIWRHALSRGPPVLD
ncbi:DUF2946 domain-containing protein [Trinickia mobilis]|uniref:DUF2946 domain-containing protein n=1 Tax=Trinickia mobilis TaxID=2816356 RepID=UPI001A8FF33F|nr:DUF2946 domain-containing protein [Trinickia mobilis]